MKIIRSWLFSFESSCVRRDFIVSLQVDKRTHFRWKRRNRWIAFYRIAQLQ